MEYQELAKLRLSFRNCLNALRDELKTHEYAKNPLCREWEQVDHMNETPPRIALYTQHFGDWALENDKWSLLLPPEDRKQELSTESMDVINKLCKDFNQKHPQYKISWYASGDCYTHFYCEMK